MGTLRNCAGGRTPSGSWLSCEETLESRSATGYAQNHGYGDDPDPMSGRIID